MSTIPYIQYMQMNSVSAGAVLQHILRQQQLKKQDVARAADIIPQRLSDLISGSRRFTPALSLRLERALQIPHHGFFYLIQSQHDIYQEERTAERRTPDLSLLTATTFWDVDLEQVDWEQGREWAIRRVLEYGTQEEVRELARFYGREALIDIAQHTEQFRMPQRVAYNIQILQEKSQA